MLYGVLQEKDIALDAIASDVERDDLLDAQLTTLNVHNQQVDRLLNIFSDPITDKQSAIMLGDTNRLQPLDEFGRPQPVKTSGHYFTGYPLYKAGTAHAEDWWAQQQMTVGDFARQFDLMLDGDINWVRDQMLATLFYNGAGFAYRNAQTAEDITVYGLANGDTNVYDKVSGAATDDHYAQQTAAIDSSNNPLTALYDELNEHPINAGRKVAFVATNLIAAIRLLPAFAPAERDLIEIVPGSATGTTDPLQAGPLGLPLTSTMTYEGIHANMYIVQWSSLPSSYIVGVAVDSPIKPLGRREYVNPRTRGFINIGEPMSRFPFQQTNFVRAMGFGGRNRIGAAVVKNAASYAAPTSLPFPLA